MGKRRLGKGQWIFWAVAFFGWFAPAGVLATSENLLVNGDFSTDAGGWIGASGGSSCSNGVPSLGAWGGQPQLTFSYMQNSVSQQVIIPSPSALELSFLANGPNGGTYSATISDSNESVTTGVLTAGENQVSNLGITTTQNDEVVTITFAGKDSLFWAGCYGPVIRNASLTVVAQPTSLVVTSLLDDGSVGTLRWAITQANAVSGGIHDSIQIPTGTITLSSALPNIAQNVTIVGSGKTSTVIDGDGQFRIFNVNNNISLTVSDLTLKRGQNTNGGLIYNNRGTVTADRVRFTGMTGGSAVFNNNGGAVSYYTDSTWDALSMGIAGDYGSTPQLGAGLTSWATTDDSVFQNRTYVTRGTFENNTYGIYNYRFTKVIDSTFNNNSATAANVTGLNRTQIINSVFTNNGTAIYHSAWIPTGWNMGTDNRLISGNTFTDNATAIYLYDGWNNGQRNQSASTISNNIWSGTGTWITYQQWDGSNNIEYSAIPSTEGTPFTQLSNTIPPPPTTTTTTTTTTIPPTTTTTEVPTTTTESPTTTTTEVPETEETTTTEPEPELTLPPDTEPESTIDTTPDTTDGGTDGGTGDSEDTTSPETTVPESAPEEETPDTTPELPVEEETSEQVVDDILADDPSPEELTDAVSDALSATESEEELVSVATELLTSDLDTEQFIAVIDEVFSQDLSDEALAELVTTVFAEDLSDEEIAAVVDQVFTADISDEAFAEVLDTIFEEPLSDEAFDSVIDAILDEPISDEAFDELVDVLGGESVSDEQVVAAVDSIIENGLSDEQSISIATSGEVLESITGDQATEIFATVPIGDISDAEAAALVEAVQDAPTEVKEAFEEEINIFAAGNVDTYVPLGSSIPVSTRRVLIAGTALTLTMIPIPVQVSPSRVGK